MSGLLFCGPLTPKFELFLKFIQQVLNPFIRDNDFEIKEVVLFNITGKKVLSVSGNGNKTMVINRDELPGGFYLMNVSVGETIVTKKLVLK